MDLITEALLQRAPLATQERRTFDPMSRSTRCVTSQTERLSSCQSLRMTKLRGNSADLHCQGRSGKQKLLQNELCHCENEAGPQTPRGQRLEALYSLQIVLSRRTASTFCVQAKSFTAPDLSQERTMIEQAQSFPRPCPLSRYIALPAGDGSQITSHPYAECRNCCHPPLRWQAVITEGEVEINKEKEGLIEYWSTLV